MIEVHEIRRLVIERRRECGIGLCGSIAAITKWLNTKHGILTSESWVADTISADQTEQT